MGRRAIEKVQDPKALRDLIGRHFRALTGRAGVNLAQFQAQLVEQEMVQLIAGFAMDATQSSVFRKECALDVLKLARGPVAPWMHDGATVDQTAPGMNPTKSHGDDISAARTAADTFQQLDDLVRRKVPPSEWPENIRMAAGDAVSFFAEAAESDG